MLRIVGTLSIIFICVGYGCNHRQSGTKVANSPRKIWSNATGMRFIYIEGATFDIGDGSVSQPFRTVKIEPTWVCEHEFRIADIEGLLGISHKVKIRMGSSSNSPLVGQDYSVVLRILQELRARDHIDYRLPTEIEWEYAARSGVRGQPYPWDGLPSRELACVDRDAPCEVKSFPPNGFGLYDVIGNAGELIADPWSSNDPEEIIDKTKEPMRLSRGGSFSYVFATLAERTPIPTVGAHNWFDIGFRIVISDSPRLHKEASVEQ